MSEDLLFYWNPQSRAQMTNFLLEELGVPHRKVLIEFDKGEGQTPDYLAINPMGKVPAIVHRGTVVTETPAIMIYLADAFPEAGLAPAIDDPQRGIWLRWIVFGGTVFEPSLTDKMLKRPEAPRAMVGHGSYDDMLRSFDAMLDPGPWILGERFSAADIYIGAELAWAASFGAPGITDNPKLADYIERIKARPAYQRSTAA